ncbi:penicillin-binding transpeptidase domain-containing protein [Corynebacterium caspium]|uniref:penicillin-binding transpeptidase domain-containing protein n=1 Tax=Corynebacterium caspium TaxID=234828 RepID=UPI000590E9DA|nr:penicillin-binding transpeptidase domain-containing protein [Corynebacterium caspium]WKD59077.1 Beta-lactam-inducible penicillin-binding protein [Corynebacterium caspium DSM 44850]
MKRLLVWLVCAVFATSFLVACTPKPKSPEPTLMAVFAATQERTWKELNKYVDRPEEAAAELQATLEGLQATDVGIDIKKVAIHGGSATVDFTTNWQLPGDRSISYDSQARLTEYKNSWLLRWEPRVIHPQLGAGQHLELRAVAANRASVLSSDGKALLTPGIQRRILVDTKGLKTQRAHDLALRIQNALDIARKVDSTVPELDRLAIAQAMLKYEGPFSVAVVREQPGGIVENELAGEAEITVNKEAALITPDSDFAPDLMSRIRNVVGDEVKGNNGWRVAIVNSQGASLADIEHHDAGVAPAVRVSVDYNVQRAAQDAVNKQTGRKAVIVAVRPSTGEILAVAQSPEADKDGDIGLRGLYPPGSTFKIITAAAGFEKQQLNPETTVPCPGTMNIYGRIVTNYANFALGNTSLRNAFAQSCNTTFADISTNLAPGELAATAKQFGVGLDYEIFGLDVVTGQVPFAEIPLERTEAGYGQGLDLVSPLGLTLMSATAATGRTPVPVLINGQETKISERTAPLAQPVLDNLRDVMRAVVTSGTGRGLKVAGEVFAKTGEAEVNEGSHSWFTGYRDDLAFTSLVVLGGGSELAVAMTNDFFNSLDAYSSGQVITP